MARNPMGNAAQTAKPKKTRKAKQEHYLQVTGVKENKRLSEETVCFTAWLWFDGVNVGEVFNRGHGGPHGYRWLSNEFMSTVTAWAKEQKTKYEHEKLDQIVDELLFQDKIRMKLTNAINAGHVVFRLKSYPSGQYAVGKYTPAQRVLAEQSIRARFNDDVEWVLVDKKDIEQCVADLAAS